MAYTAPKTWATAEVVTAAMMNTHVRDNEDALAGGIAGDTQSVAAVIHRHKTGAAGSAPPAVGNAGRIYLPDGQIMAENNAGTARYGFGPGPYDDFFNDDRSGTTTITPSTSGHTWTESTGSWEIASNLLIPTSGTCYASLETNCYLNRLHKVTATFTFGTGANDIGIITKFADSSNFLFVQMTKTALNLYSRIGTTETSRGSLGVTFADTDQILMELVSFGETLIVRATKVNSAAASTNIVAARHSDFAHANLAAATSVGVRAVGAIAGCSSFRVDF